MNNIRAYHFASESKERKGNICNCPKMDSFFSLVSAFPPFHFPYSFEIRQSLSFRDKEYILIQDLNQLNSPNTLHLVAAKTKGTKRKQYWVFLETNDKKKKGPRFHVVVFSFLFFFLWMQTPQKRCITQGYSKFTRIRQRTEMRKTI